MEGEGEGTGGGEGGSKEMRGYWRRYGGGKGGRKKMRSEVEGKGRVPEEIWRRERREQGDEWEGQVNSWRGKGGGGGGVPEEIWRREQGNEREGQVEGEGEGTRGDMEEGTRGGIEDRLTDTHMSPACTWSPLWRQWRMSRSHH